MKARAVSEAQFVSPRPPLTGLGQLLTALPSFSVSIKQALVTHPVQGCGDHQRRCVKKRLALCWAPNVVGSWFTSQTCANIE